MTTTKPAPPAVGALGAGFLWLQILWCLAGGLFVWIIRDGLGPDSTTTTGAAALYRMFWTFYWGPTSVAFLIIDALWWRRRRHAARNG